jgi:hypothetical protein
MKNSKSFILSRLLSRCRTDAVIGLTLIASMSGTSSSQQYVSQEGHLLDANPSLGSFGWNTPARLDALIPRANAYITGNIRGGQSFQGLVPYRSQYEFTGNLGSSTLSDFTRDSVGVRDLSNSVGPPQYYLDPSRQMTGTFGNRVLPSNQVFQQNNITPMGSALITEGPRSTFSSRPLNQPYMAINAPPGEFAPLYQQRRETALGLSAAPTGLFPPANIQGQKNLPGLPENQPAEIPTGSPIRPEFEAPLRTAPENMAASAPSTRIENEPPGFYLNLEKKWEQSAPAEEPTGAGQNAQAGNRTTAKKTEPSTKSPVIAPNAATTEKRLAAVSAGNETADQFKKRFFNAYMQKGERFMREGRYYQAADAFGNAAFYDSRNPLVWLAQSHALFASGEFLSSAYYLNKSLNLAVPPPGSESDLKRIFPNIEEFNKRFEDLKTWQERSGEPMMLFLKGYIEYQTGDLPQAVKTLTDAAKQLPNVPAVVKLLDAATQAQKQ